MTVENELRTAIYDYVSNHYQSTNVGRVYSTTDPKQVGEFADWFADLAMSAVRLRDKKAKKSESVDG